MATIALFPAVKVEFFVVARFDMNSVSKACSNKAVTDTSLCL